jgi:hypothetical protein
MMNVTHNNKRQLLDPLGTMCHIVSLAFKPLNTKIGISNHAVIIQESNRLQWFERYWYGDNRENISLLYNIVVRIIEWYIIPLINKYKDCSGNIITNTVSFDNLTKDDLKIFWVCLEKMIMYVCMAFDKLQFTYHSGPVPTNVILATQYFITILKASLNGTYCKELLPRCMIEGENKTFLDYDKIKLLWCGKKLQKITDLYEKCFQISTSTDPTKEDQIDGYMSAINKLLTIHDEEFRKLIYLSNEG